MLVCPLICSFVLLFVHSFFRSFVHYLVKSFSQDWLVRFFCFFFFFAWSLGTIDAKKWRSPIFVENSVLPKIVKKGPKIGHFAFFGRYCNFFFQKTMKIPKIHLIPDFPLQTLCRAKFLFTSYRSKCSWSIRWWDSLKCNISRK